MTEIGDGLAMALLMANEDSARRILQDRLARMRRAPDPHAARAHADVIRTLCEQRGWTDTPHYGEAVAVLTKGGAR